MGEGGRDEAATTHCREDSNGYPATGGLWTSVGHNPLSALGTGREVRQDLRDHFGLLDNTGICHDCKVLPCLRRIRHKTNKAPTARSPITIVGPPFSLTLPTGPPDTPPQRIRGPPGGREKQLLVPPPAITT